MKNPTNDKYYALCLVCKKELQNTSSSRLQMHRSVCKLGANGSGPIPRKRCRVRDESSSSTESNIDQINNNTETKPATKEISSENGRHTELEKNLEMEIHKNAVAGDSEEDFVDFGGPSSAGVVSQSQLNYKGISRNLTSCEPSTSTSFCSSVSNFVDSMSKTETETANFLLSRFFLAVIYRLV